MKKQNKKILVVVGAVVLCALSALVFIPNGEGGAASECTLEKKDSLAGKKAKKLKKTARKTPRKRRSLAQMRQDRSTVAGRAVAEEENSDLAPEFRKMMEAIGNAVDNDDKAALLLLVQTLQKMQDWPDSVPQSVRLAAVEALEWFGSSCLPEAVGFLSDPDEDVVQCALGQFEDAVEDTDKSDRERANILVMAAGVVTDSDTMDSMLFELNNLRNSVAVDAIKLLWESGNDVTRSLLPDAVESVTGEENIDTPEKLDAWLKENPDEED